MLFNTVQFAIFFAVVLTLHFLLPQHYRRPLLLAASYYFYLCWSVKYISVIFAITLIDFYLGIQIENTRGRGRKILLAVSMVSNFGLLFVFKYADFFLAPVLGSGGSGHWLNLLLPMGISFHTFQAVSYTFDVYRGDAPAERRLLNYALYVAFFPQMVAGPIERPGHLLPQFHRATRLEYARVTSGLRVILWGLIKKCVVADLAAPVVNTVYSHPQGFSGPLLALATALFAVQIYCDFSGYSDIAVGTARILGYDLTINFRQPYLAVSVGEFWRRWHISLSTWFRDYLYIPLGGSRGGRIRWAFNIMLVFLVSGLWHGANWTFLVWGALHGCFVLLEAVPVKIRLPLVFRIIATNLAVALAWIFFRAQSVQDGWYILTNLLNTRGFHAENLFRVGLPRFELSFLLLATAALFTAEKFRHAPPGWWGSRNLRWTTYAVAVYTIVFFGVFNKIEFIYFQF